MAVRRRFGTLALDTVAYTESTRKKRAEAREAASAARRQRLEDTKANYRALRIFLDAKYRLAKVDLWLDTRITELHEQADTLRVTHRLEAAKALAHMTVRGMTVEDIAQMAGVTAETVHDYLSGTTGAPPPATPDA